jgi:transcriptional regulator with XRE-family HTH domain
MPTSGTDLKVERVRARVTLVSLAARMGLSRQAVWGMERSAVVTGERAQAYRAALVALRDDRETSEAAVA